MTYHVYEYDWDNINGKQLMSVAKTFEHAADLVNDYSERFPHAYFDYEEHEWQT